MADATANAAVSAAPPPAAKASGLRNPRVRVGLSLLGVLALVAAIAAGAHWLVYGRFIQSTDDAYLRADVVTVAPRVGGYVQALYVQDNQQVVVGQPLLRIDLRNYQAALSQQTATVDARAADITAAENQIRQQQALSRRIARSSRAPRPTRSSPMIRSSAIARCAIRAWRPRSATSRRSISAIRHARLCRPPRPACALRSGSSPRCRASCCRATRSSRPRRR